MREDATLAGSNSATLPMCLARSEGSFFALYDECSHAEVPLSEGEVEEGFVECWLHGSMFDLSSGKPTGLPATEPVRTYRGRGPRRNDLRGRSRRLSRPDQSEKFD